MNVLLFLQNMIVDIIIGFRNVILWGIPLCFIINTLIIICFVIKAAIENNISILEVIHRCKEALCDSRAFYRNEKAHALILIFQYELSIDKINANSAIPGIVLVKPKWIDFLAKKEPDWRLAFLHTMGHELGHKRKEPAPLRDKTEKARFTNWVRECRADFFGIEFVLRNVKKAKQPIKRKDIIEAVKLKAKEYTKNGDHSDLYRQPYWHIRCDLVEHIPQFNKKVIEKIAELSGFDDDSYIFELADSAINF